jgi:hypothetical protein
MSIAKVCGNQLPRRIVNRLWKRTLDCCRNVRSSPDDIFVSAAPLDSCGISCSLKGWCGISASCATFRNTSSIVGPLRKTSVGPVLSSRAITSTAFSELGTTYTVWPGRYFVVKGSLRPCVVPGRWTGYPPLSWVFNSTAEPSHFSEPSEIMAIWSAKTSASSRKCVVRIIVRLLRSTRMIFQILRRERGSYFVSRGKLL